MLNDREPGAALPRWDLTAIFPGLDSDEFRSCVAQLEAEIIALAAAARSASLSVDEIATRLERYNASLELAEVAEGYAVCQNLADSASEPARAWAARTRAARGALQQVERELMTLAAQPATGTPNFWPATLQEHAFWMRQARTATHDRLPGDEEDLADKLNVTGGAAWEALRHETVGSMMVPLNDGGKNALPLVAFQQRSADPDRAVRLRAYHAEISAWESVAPVVSAALNSIKGEVLVMSQRRGWASPLDQSLHENRIDRDTLDAMFSAAESSLTDMRRYLKTKATAIGVPQLGWHDLYAPVSEDAAAWPFETARGLIIESFGRYSADARALAQTAFSQGWIDAEPRPNKRGGGMCVTLGEGRSRVLVNYSPTFDGVRMLTHELGHAYHAHVLDRAGRTATQRWMTPWVLSETAAIFFETLVRDAVVRESDPANRLVAVESNLQILCRRVVEILNAFRFEQQVFSRRKNGALSVDELKKITSAVQRETYGDSLDPDRLHPFMWAALPHYYTTESSFNNYPYMFGTLFSLGLYARFQVNPAGFSAPFDDFLSLTGMADAVTLAGRFDIDLRSPAFWLSGIELIRQEIGNFEKLIQKEAGAS